MAARKTSSPKPVSRTSVNSEDSGVEPLNQYVCEQVRNLRKQKGWTLEQLSSHCNVSRSMLSQVERGNANPTLSVAFRIAQALGVSLADLVEGAASRQPIEVVRKSDPAAVFRDDEVCTIRTLSPANFEKEVEFYQVTLKPRQRMTSGGHFAGTREFLTVNSGTVVVRSGTQTIELKPGDSAQYTADVEHSIENIGRSNAVLFLVDIYSN